MDDDCQQANSGSPVNLYIEDIVYIDNLNVVISVRRGPVEESLWLVGLNSTAWRADRVMKSRTLHYFLNMETMQIRASAQWIGRVQWAIQHLVSDGQHGAHPRHVCCLKFQRYVVHTPPQHTCIQVEGWVSVCLLI